MFVVKVIKSEKFTFWYRNEIGSIFCVYKTKRINEYCLANDNSRLLFIEDCEMLGEVIKIKNRKV